VPSKRLTTSLEDYPLVNLLDMDVQGAETGIVDSSINVMNKRVRRVHIGAHSPEIDAFWSTSCIRTDGSLDGHSAA
jgi:hypothetical protein